MNWYAIIPWLILPASAFSLIVVDAIGKARAIKHGAYAGIGPRDWVLVRSRDVKLIPKTTKDDVEEYLEGYRRVQKFYEAKYPTSTP